MRSPIIAYATVVVETVWPARRDGAGHRDAVDEHARHRIGVQPIEVDQRDADHRERAVVQRRLAIRELVVSRERIAVEVHLRGLRPADVGILAIG